MRIGITQRIIKEPKHGEHRDELSHDWVDYFTNNFPKALLIPIPNFTILDDDWFENLNLEASIEQKHVSIEHEVQIVNEKYIQMLEKKSIKVNSYHNHGVLVDGLSSSLQAFAISEGSVVEGFFHEELPIIGIQWHPERPNNCQLENKILIESITDQINEK